MFLVSFYCTGAFGGFADFDANNHLFGEGVVFYLHLLCAATGLCVV